MRIADNANNPEKVLELTTKAKDTIRKRQKLTRLADKSKNGWLVVEEFESDEIASDTDDERTCIVYREDNNLPCKR